MKLINSYTFPTIQRAIQNIPVCVDYLTQIQYPKKWIIWFDHFLKCPKVNLNKMIHFLKPKSSCSSHKFKSGSMLMRAHNWIVCVPKDWVICYDYCHIYYGQYNGIQRRSTVYKIALAVFCVAYLQLNTGYGVHICKYRNKKNWHVYTKKKKLF